LNRKVIEYLNGYSFRQDVQEAQAGVFVQMGGQKIRVIFSA